MNRRQFVKTTAGAAVFLAAARRAYPFAQSPTTIGKFVVPLPGLGPTGIPLLTQKNGKAQGIQKYEAVATEFMQQVHPALPATKFWGYADAANPGSARYLGGVIVAKRGTPVQLTMTNGLPPMHFLPVDPTTSLAEGGGRQDRIAVHLHGGLVDWTSDGGPFAWFSNPANGGFVHGSSFMNGAGLGSAVYDYPNQQSARLVWYHDHAYGNTRLNAYAGLASAYLMTDDSETQLIASGVLPNIQGYPLGIPLIIQDKTFRSDGSLWYPSVYEANPPDGASTGRWDLGPHPSGLPQTPSCVPEFFADTILVNGAPYPVLPVSPRRFRFRLLNGSQARFYNLQMYVAGSADGVTLAPSSDGDPNNGIPLQIPSDPAGPAFIQIGTEGGFLPAPVAFGDPVSNTNSNRPIGYDTNPASPTFGNVDRYNLLLAPAERADVIIDFRGFAGQTIVLYSDTPAPFPAGDVRNDYYTGDPDHSATGDATGGAPTTLPGSGPNTRTLMIFVVSNAAPSTEPTLSQTWTMLNTALPLAYAASQPQNLSTSGLTPLVKTLNEDFDGYGRLRQILGAGGGPGLELMAAPTEVAHVGDTQVWTIYNRTGDTHPIHFHLVNVQVLSRQPFTETTPGAFSPAGPSRGPDANELGWKETVRMNPAEATTVIMKFDRPSGPPGQMKKVPFSPRLKASFGINGFEFVWHCHILEHEEHDMMRPLVILP